MNASPSRLLLAPLLLVATACAVTAAPLNPAYILRFAPHPNGFQGGEAPDARV